MFVRFVIQRNDEDSGRRQGLFQAYDDIYEWFRKNLRTPRSFTRSTKPHAKKVALSWFKDGATEHIRNMRAIAGILDTHGIQVEVLHTERPGYVVYEDTYQVAAEPFSETAT
jgi:hypothetical protein